MKNQNKFWGIRILAAAVLALGVVSCQVPESERVPEVLEIIPASTNPNALQSTLEVTVRCDLHWTAELLDSSWGSVKVTQVTEGSGGTFTFEMGVNKSEEARENTLIVKAGKGEIRKTVIQGGLGTCFSPRSLQLSGTKEGSVSFVSPAAWTASVAEGADWLEVKTASGQAGSAQLVVVAKDPNENVGSRSGAVRIAVGGDTFDIAVEQGQQDVILSEDSALSFTFEEREFSVGTSYNVDYEVEVSASWITYVKSKAPLHQGTEAFVMEENPSPNARTAEICFSAPRVEPLVLTIVQGGKDPVLNSTHPGFYGINDLNYLVGAAGWNQYSRMVSPNGSVRYRLLKGSSLSVAELTGYKQDAQPGDKLDLEFRLRTKDETKLIKNYSVEVLYEKDGLVWLKQDNDIYFIVHK